MAEQKTKPTQASVEQFLKGVADEQQRADSFALLGIMQQATGLAPKMWGSSIVGFGQYHYKYASGHEGDTCLAGFSPRKQALTLYLPGGFDPHAELLGALGKHKLGKGCLYIKRLADVHQPTLKKLIRTMTRQFRPPTG